ELADPEFPLETSITGWSPFLPGNADSASLPVAAIEYSFVNRSATPIDAMFSFHAENFLPPAPDVVINRPKSTKRIRPIERGFMLYTSGAAEQPWDEGSLAFWVDADEAIVDHRWYRRGVDEALDHLWGNVQMARSANNAAVDDDSAPGASIYSPMRLAPGERRTITVRVAWYMPRTNVAEPSISLHRGIPVMVPPQQPDTYRPWYAGRFADIGEVMRYWNGECTTLRAATRRFTDALHASTLPREAMEAIDNNLTILKSPTVLRQIDGRFWAWEGSYDEYGSCWGSSTHVWNYAQALAHLQPELERSLRETEFDESQEPDGHQRARVPLPIRRTSVQRDLELDPYTSPPAADGQLGGILKTYREWRISGDSAWLQKLWPRVRASLDHCIRTWDPRERGWLEEPHLNTYDVEFWGPDGLHSSLYVAALTSAARMAGAVGDGSSTRYAALAGKARAQMERELFNGEYFYQRTMWTGLDAKLPRESAFWKVVLPESPEVEDATRRQGPPDQYGTGCLSDGVFGLWLARMCGMDDQLIDPAMVDSHLAAVFRHNFRASFRTEPAYGRPFMACGDEPGLLVCSWPRGGRPDVPFRFSQEVWAGIEYQVAGHLVMTGRAKEASTILRGIQRRYDGTARNPYSSLEAGHWYGRALASYGLLQAYGGARYDAVDRVIYLSPSVTGDFECFLAAATGYGLVGVRDGKPFVSVVDGQIPYQRIEYTPAA
ncbi:MAG: GH116 family glycosyl hydrolase, partial [Steroidobacteraceae bacterium]